MVDLVFTLTDLSEGKAYYVGAAPVSIEIGKSDSLDFESNGRAYNIELDTSYGKLPTQTEKP